MAIRTAFAIRSIFKKSNDWHELSEAELAQLKQVMLEISDDIVAFCEKNNLKYCMAYGTALGSVRHKGYIPWDDDVDFFMPRKDYERFMHLAANDTKFSNKYVVRSVTKGDKVSFPTLHIRKKGTLYVNYGDLVMTNNEPEIDRGIYIDIASLDNSSDLSVVRNLKAYLSLFYLFAASCINVYETVQYIINHKIQAEKDDMQALKLKAFLGKCFSVIPLYKWMKYYDDLSRSNHNESSKYVISYCGMKKIYKGTYERKVMYPFVKGLFEGRHWYLPHNADAYLTIEYNDYMTIPKKADRQIHPVFYLNFDTTKQTNET